MSGRENVGKDADIKGVRNKKVIVGIILFISATIICTLLETPWGIRVGFFMLGFIGNIIYRNVEEMRKGEVK